VSEHILMVGSARIAGARIEHTMQLASMRENMGWGLVFVTSLDSGADDDGLPEQFPMSADGDQPTFMSSAATTAIRVQHGSDGDVVVRLWAGPEEWGRHGSVELGVTRISAHSGRLTVSDVLREKCVEASIPPGNYRVQISGDALNNPAEIDLVLADLRGD
jgi:hypothetical protein